ncbi:beta-galactosidase [Agromyces rhizosphaerae]|uniref:Beta-galactosidase n=1 Tax=Agromyces rhizosphaerae TaxID=88374 RepID=A0A9W6FQ95_9MICO|nr:DUF5597 domain-containing protein [Agromyces rhizosphaerae]GLI26357.1 beta-galactosidase [Agromyces rhizosphaerae]
MSVRGPRSALLDGRLMVDDAPFLILGAELHNSSTSAPASIDAAWQAVERCGANTVLAPVAWDQWEPAEGQFSTQLVDHLLRRARAGGQRLVLLWFGSWKNGVSSYSPAWVKSDPERFPLARDSEGTTLMALSAFAESNMSADARAFAGLMRHLRDVDGDHGTVVMVQVENEVGLLGSARDHSALARSAWEQRPPERFEVDTWSNVDSDQARAGEAFMAWHYARYVNSVIEAGRREWDLPMYVNAWLDGGEDATPMAGGTDPGDFPSGGPVPRVLGIWAAAAPALSFASPDVYVGDVADRAAAYGRRFGVRFVPEMRRDSAAQLFRAAAAASSIGMAPFGIDSAGEVELDDLARAYRQLGAVAPILVARPPHERAAVHVDDARPHTEVVLDGWRFRIERDFDPQGEGNRPDGHCLLVADGGRFLAVGYGVVVHAFRDADGAAGWVLDCAELDPDALEPVRWLNGDETGGGTHIRITRDDPPGFGPVPIDGSRTGILSFALYPQPS